ncbi:efflux RND transporter periplasmic adaptor subunit [Arcobacter roscoffensis]|uniref:Efflux RND transporter periplasmic adaptor subunit n=1 Tax=Arcobacter roscoffensis TaxID=2961520 RepID=A0ABY5E6H5_9BACT|nr:efflux RND transporter periplasmic adaptor subunit [Arcobacter roscoffensis]UTJ07227.1 efflux RND transporter periplasmic adaptor subunit [Arcobacter roscoffensis]
MKNLVLAIFILVAFTACQEKEEKVQKQDIKTVFATLPIAKDSNENRVFNATAISNNETKLSFKVEGNIIYLKTKIGDEVKKDELIAKLDSKPYELRVSQIKYALSEARASLQNAKSTYERVKKLYINQNASVSDIDKAKAAYEATSAKVKNITKELDYAKLKLSYTKLYSPMNAYISLKYVHENENVAVGTPVVLLGDKLIDEVSVQVPESIINRIKQNDLVKVVFTSLDKNRVFTAKVKEVSKYASSKSKTYKVVAKLNNSSNLIKSGMSADVYFNLLDDSKTSIYCVPSNSVLNDKEGYFVYTLIRNEKSQKDYMVKKTMVKVGELTSDGFEILEGLNSDDLVLKAGMSEVYEQMKVQISNLKDLGK